MGPNSIDTNEEFMSKYCIDNNIQYPSCSSWDEPSCYVALDCEMVGVGPNGTQSSAASVTVIDWNGKVLFHSYIRQTVPVTDYRTFVSGITKHHLEDQTMTPSYLRNLGECSAIVANLLYNRILIGHAVDNDLRVLGITHPWWLTRDTAAYEPFMWCRIRRISSGKKKKQRQQRNKSGATTTKIFFPRKLKHLAKEKLDRDIQVEGRPHCAYEDALAALDLYRTERCNWESVVIMTLQQQQQQQLFYHSKVNNMNRARNVYPNPNKNTQEQLDMYY